MNFSLLPIEQDQNEHIIHRVVAFCMKQYRQTADRKIKEKISINLFKITRLSEN